MISGEITVDDLEKYNIIFGPLAQEKLIQLKR